MHALLDPVPPATIPLLAMVRLNDALLTALASPDPSPLDARADDSTQVPTASSLPAAGLPPCPALEPHLLAVRMQLLPILSKLMSAHTDSLRRINGSPAAGSGAGGGGGGVGGMFARATAAAGGGTGGAVKDSVVKVVIGRYAELFHAAVALWNEDLDGEGLAADAAREGDAAAAAAAERRRSKPVEGDDEMVFARFVSSPWLEGLFFALLCYASVISCSSLTSDADTACCAYVVKSTSCSSTKRRNSPTRQNSARSWSLTAKNSCTTLA